MKKQMKLLAVVLAACLGCFALVGCGSGGSSSSTASESGITSSVVQKTPSIVVRETLDASGKGNSAIRQAMMKSMYKSIESSMDGVKLTKAEKAVLSKLVYKMLDYSFTVRSETIKGNKASVKVNFKTYDFSKVMDKAIDEVYEEAYEEAEAGENLTEKKVTAMLFDELDDQLDDITKKSRTSYATIKLKQNGDGEWEVKSLGKDVQKALLGGLDESKYVS